MFKKSPFKDLTFANIHSLYSDPHDAERFFFNLKWKDGFTCSKYGHNHCTTVIRKMAFSEPSISALTVVIGVRYRLDST